MIFTTADKEEILAAWSTRGETSKDKWEILSQFIEKKVNLNQLAKKSVGNKSGPHPPAPSMTNQRAYKRIKHLKEEIILTFLYPRLDAHVSTDIGHLLKSPFCVHPKTGKVCVPFKTENLNTFDPFSSPSLKELVRDYHQGYLKELFLQFYMIFFIKMEKILQFIKGKCSNISKTSMNLLESWMFSARNINWKRRRKNQVLYFIKI